MTPHTPHTPNDLTEETRRSRPDVEIRTDDNTERDAGAATPADVTVVRVKPSAVTITEIVGVTDATNFGKYQLDGELARGGMGVVYKARQKGLDRHVALKMILGTDTDKEAAQRFLQEARAAAALDHPNVVPIYDIDEIGGKPYFTMALIEGPNLRGYIDTKGTPPVPNLISLFAQIVSGVAHAHRHGIVHRDLKPANVLIDKDGRPRVTDFGLAKRASADTNLTTTGQVVGTPAYMAPEQARDSKEVGPPADVYSLGAILYFMLTGKAPFHAESVTDLLIKVVMEPPAPPRELRPEIPGDVEELCLRCLSKNPADRFPDAQELLAALGPIADQYLSPSANLTPSAAQIPFPKARTTPSLPSVPFVNALDSVPSLGKALQRSGPAHVQTPPAPVAAAPAPEVYLNEPVPTKANRKPVLFALGGLALALACVAGFLATRDKPKPTEPGAGSEPKPVEVAHQGPGGAFNWPATARGDFELKVDLSAPAAVKGANGALQLVPGTPMVVHLKAARDCRVSVWVLDPAGHVTRLFPNDDEPDDRLTAGVERVVPGNAKYTLETTPTDGEGHERIRVIATTGDQPAFPPGAKNGRFTTYSAHHEREKLASTVRGVVVKKADGSAPAHGAISEAEILFRACILSYTWPATRSGLDAPEVLMLPIAVLLLAVAAPPPPPDAFQRAERLAAADRFGEAEPLYLAALGTDSRFLKRETYNRLMTLYVRSGRPDKALKTGAAFRAWLETVGDPDGPGALELLTAQCQLDLGYPDAAGEHLRAALAAKPALAPERKLDALRLGCEVAAQKRDGTEKGCWAGLEREAGELLKGAERANLGALRVAAGRALAEARTRRGDLDGALAALENLPALHDKLDDPLGRRDTQRQRAKWLAARGDYARADALFSEALALHRKLQPDQRVFAGDVLAEWVAAALAAGKQAEAAKLRDRAAAEYQAALEPGADAGGALTAFVRLQALTRSAKQFTQALEAARQAGARWSGDALLDARLKADQGGLELIASSYPAARKLLVAALADLDAAEPVNLRAVPKVLVNLATAELGCDAPDGAESALKRCVELYRKHKLPPDVLRVEADYLSGVASSRKGDFAGAMAHFRAGLALCNQVGADANAVRFNLWLNIALIHKEQGDAGAAGEALARSADVLARFPEHDALSAALIDSVRADLYLSQGQVKDAVALVPALESVCEKLGHRTGHLWGTARHVRALALLTQKETAAAEAVWLELAEGQRKEGHVLLARTLNFLGICAELRGQNADAVKRFEEARAFQATRPRCPAATRAITLWRLAALADKAGRPAEAKRLLGEVFDVADRARLNTFGEAAQRAQFFAQFAPAFEMLAGWCARDGDGEGLLRVVARSRSRTLLDQMLAAGLDPRDRLTGDARKALVEREADARRAVSGLRSRAMLFTPAQADQPEAKKLLAELESAQKEYADAWREIANADPMTRVLTDPAFAEQALAQVRKEAHRAGGVLLTYMIGRDASFAVLCTSPTANPEVFKLGLSRAVANDVGEPPAGDLVARAGFRGVAIKPVAEQPAKPAPAAVVEVVALTDAVAARLVNHYLRQIADPSFNPTRGIALVSRTPGAGPKPFAAEGLGDAVLPGALRDRIRASGAKRLVLVPDGALHKLPFEALLLTGEGGPRYALDELPPVCYAPSIGALAVVLSRPRANDGAASLLTVGDPAYPEAGVGTSRSGGSLPRLPFTATESKKVRQYFATDKVTALEQESATEANVVAALPGKRFVHLAAHGFADEAFGNAFAAVALTPPPRGREEPGNDGFLTLHEISRLKLSGCELTVLSACVTNVGPQRPLEAGVTLAGAFLGAGSRGVMASCWSVDDRATAEMMSAFFGAIRADQGKNASYPEAMKGARLAVKRTPGWESPFFWAPFVYVAPPPAKPNRIK